MKTLYLSIFLNHTILTSIFNPSLSLRKHNLQRIKNDNSRELFSLLILLLYYLLYYIIILYYLLLFIILLLYYYLICLKRWFKE